MTPRIAPSGAAFHNDLLTALSDGDFQHLYPHIQRVTLIVGQILYESGEHMDHVYFLESGLVSHTADTKDNGFVEIGMTGREGMVGASIILNPDAIAIHRTIVQGDGSAIRMRTAAFNEVSDRSPVFRARCLRYVQVLMVQASQSAACNARHDLPARLARWLLMNRDRVDSDAMQMTQEFLAVMLGVRRAGVSVVANALQSTGAIQQSRGRITILNRGLLEAQACNCYRFVEDARRNIMRKPQNP
jgi:CRP-like cAMP-binding protein